MPSQLNTPAAGQASAVTVVTTAETVAVTAGNIIAPNQTPRVYLNGTLDITIGTGGVTLTVKLERGTVAGGTVVATWGPATVVAGNRYVIDVNAVDLPGEIHGASYVMTVTVGSASGNSTVNTAILQATSTTGS